MEYGHQPAVIRSTAQVMFALRLVGFGIQTIAAMIAHLTFGSAKLGESFNYSLSGSL